MFTGLIEEVGTIKDIKKGAASAVLTIGASVVLEDAKIGDSIAVNGICLTVTSRTANTFCADVMHETLNRTSLAKLSPGGKVNLERAMPANGRFGGHIVSGHIDGTGNVASIKKDDNAILYTIEAPADIIKGIVEKGSITIDGISLTVTAVTSKTFTVSIIPHTAANTILQYKKVGDPVNLENDIIGKYVERLLTFGSIGANSAPSSGSKITSSFLAENGFF